MMGFYTLIPLNNRPVYRVDPGHSIRAKVQGMRSPREDFKTPLKGFRV